MATSLAKAQKNPATGRQWSFLTGTTMNTQVQNQALNEQPPNQNRKSDIHKHDHEQLKASNKKSSSSTGNIAASKTISSNRRKNNSR